MKLPICFTPAPPPETRNQLSTEAGHGWTSLAKGPFHSTKSNGINGLFRYSGSTHRITCTCQVLQDVTHQTGSITFQDPVLQTKSIGACSPWPPLLRRYVVKQQNSVHEKDLFFPINFQHLMPVVKILCRGVLGNSAQHPSLTQQERIREGCRE